MQVQKAQLPPHRSRVKKPRTCATDAAKMKQFELLRLEKCDVRVKSGEARDIQLEALGAARE